MTLTAVQLARDLGVGIFFGYADPGRVVEREFPDGTVQHADLDPDLSDDEQWRRREAPLTRALAPDA